jgi:hypothetical protein
MPNETVNHMTKQEGLAYLVSLMPTKRNHDLNLMFRAESLAHLGYTITKIAAVRAKHAIPEPPANTLSESDRNLLLSLLPTVRDTEILKVHGFAGKITRQALSQLRQTHGLPSSNEMRALIKADKIRAKEQNSAQLAMKGKRKWQKTMMQAAKLWRQGASDSEIMVAMKRRSLGAVNAMINRYRSNPECGHLFPVRRSVLSPEERALRETIDAATMWAHDESLDDIAQFLDVPVDQAQIVVDEGLKQVADMQLKGKSAAAIAEHLKRPPARILRLLSRILEDRPSLLGL